MQASTLLDPAADNEMHESVHAIASCGVSPVVRIAANEGWMVKRYVISSMGHSRGLQAHRALDAGAHGVLVSSKTASNHLPHRH